MQRGNFKSEGKGVSLCTYLMRADLKELYTDTTSEDLLAGLNHF